MTTITIEEDIDIKEDSFATLSDFLSSLAPELVYEEFLESKMQFVKNSQKDDFVNI